MAAVVLWALLGPATAIDPLYAMNITVYHVNPKPYGAKPINMDTGDAAGDLFFDLAMVLITPLSCPNGAASGHDCSNPETISDDLVLNKLVLEVDSRWSSYAMCNIGRNGSDGFNHTCADDTYCCFCGTPGNWNSTSPLSPLSSLGAEMPCNLTVGRENVTGRFNGGGNSSWGHGCKTGQPEYQCFNSNVPKKFHPENPGWWYSSLSTSYCGDDSTGEGNCTWRVVEVVKIVNKTCHANAWTGVVQAQGVDCFQKCPQPTNSSSACWVTCFYETILGPGGGVPGGVVTPETGMPIDTLIKAWQAPFESDDPFRGGCPDLR